MSIIKPTVGRIVYYYETIAGAGATNGKSGFITIGPHAATVTQVHSDNCVNLAVFNQNGNGTFGRTSIKLLAPGETRPFHTNSNAEQWAEWIPYQIEQANNANLIGAGVAAKERFGQAIAAPATSPLDQVRVGTAQSAQKAEPPGPPRGYADVIRSSDEGKLLNRLRCIVDALLDGMPHKRAMAELDTIVNGGNN